MGWLGRYGASAAMGAIAVGAAASALFITFDGVEAGGLDCGSISAPDVRSPACGDRLDQNREARVAALATAGLTGAAALAIAAVRRRRPPGVVETERLRIRRAVPADAAAVVDTLDAEALAGLGWTTDARTQAGALFARGDDACWVVVDRWSGVVVGGVVSPRVEGARTVSIDAAWLRAAFRGQRLMAEAVRGIVARLHDDGAEVVVASVPSTAPAAAAIVRVAGFELRAEEPGRAHYLHERTG